MAAMLSPILKIFLLASSAVALSLAESIASRDRSICTTNSSVRVSGLSCCTVSFSVTEASAATALAASVVVSVSGVSFSPQEEKKQDVDAIRAMAKRRKLFTAGMVSWRLVGVLAVVS